MQPYQQLYKANADDSQGGLMDSFRTVHGDQHSPWLCPLGQHSIQPFLYCSGERRSSCPQQGPLPVAFDTMRISCSPPSRVPCHLLVTHPPACETEIEQQEGPEQRFSVQLSEQSNTKGAAWVAQVLPWTPSREAQGVLFPTHVSVCFI